MLMYGWDFEVDAWSRFWRCLMKICVRICDMTSRSYFGKMTSTLGSVVPLAMFKYTEVFQQIRVDNDAIRFLNALMIFWQSSWTEKYSIHLSQLKVFVQPSLGDAATHIVAAPCCNPSLSPSLCHRAWPEQELGALRYFLAQTSSPLVLVLFNIAGVGCTKRKVHYLYLEMFSPWVELVKLEQQTSSHQYSEKQV